MVNSSSGKLERATHHVAFFSLFQSALISMVAPSVIYRLGAPHFAAGSLIPLALSGIPPALALAYGIFKLKALDFLGLFAAENVAIDMIALLLSHTEKGALLGRATQNPILALFFFGSLVIGKPLVMSMSRQLSTGNNLAKRAAFDAVACQPHAIQVYKRMTWVWAIALLVKAVGNVIVAELCTTKEYLIFNSIWSLVTDATLVTWTILYGRAKLVESGEKQAERTLPQRMKTSA
jgi:hypothetical protein